MQRGSLAILLFFGLFVLLMMVGRWKTAQLDAAWDEKMAQRTVTALNVVTKRTVRDALEALTEKYVVLTELDEGVIETMSVEEMGRTGAAIITERGTIVIQFFPEAAPLSVRNFLSLVNAGFYHDMDFHRVLKGFIIQGGRAWTEYDNVPAEIQNNPHKHVTGAVAMARKPSDMNSANTQFYICLDDLPEYDGQYTVFGQVVDGMDVAEAIAEVDVDADGKPRDDVRMIRVVLVERRSEF